MPGKFNYEKKAVVGGTFDILHEGHKALLKKSFELGGVTIGLTSNKMAEKSRERKVRAFAERKKALEKFAAKGFPRKARIVKIEDRFGPTLKEDFDYIVVSPETYKTALLINQERKKLKKRPIKIIKIKLVLGKDGKPVSASKLLQGKSVKY